MHVLRHCLFLLTFVALASAAEPQFKTKFYALSLSPDLPQFTWFAIDGLGEGRLGENPVIATATTNRSVRLEKHRTGGVKSRVLGQKDYFVYLTPGDSREQTPLWQVDCEESVIVLRSEYTEGSPALPLRLVFDQDLSPATLLGIMDARQPRMKLPAVLHLPDQGSVRITGGRKAGLVYEARRAGADRPFVSIEFPPATPDDRKVEYRLEVTAIYPDLKEIRGDPQFNGFRRGFLNALQLNPRARMLANSSSGDPCAYTLYQVSEVARHAPRLAGDLTALDLLRHTLDEYLVGQKGLGQAGYGTGATDADVTPWESPYTSLDALPSLLIAACNYAETSGDLAWAKAHYVTLKEWAREMTRPDRNGNGIMEHAHSGIYGASAPMRPSNWWRTINYGHEDAYANALIYRACLRFSGLARKLDNGEDAQGFSNIAAKMAVSYVPNFLNPETGVLAGWRSADGRLHDYWFLAVNSAAISAGLVDPPTANKIMDRFLTKMQQTGATNATLGLPGNLVPIRKGDYRALDQAAGQPALEDGSDLFQRGQNGGATGCHAWFTVRALYQLGRVQDARLLLFDLLKAYEAGSFLGRCPESGKGKTWRDWQGGCQGEELLLPESYLALLAVLDEAAARQKEAR